MRQAAEHVLEVLFRVDAVHLAVLDDRVHHGVLPAAALGAEEQPVFFADRAGPDGVLDEVVVDLQAPIVAAI